MARLLSSTLVALVFAAASLTAQQASFATFGQGCSDPTGLTPAIGATGNPKIGQAFTVTYTGPSRATWPTETRPVLLFGFTTTQFTIPQFSKYQPANCTIWIAPAFSVPMGLDPSSPIKFASSLTLQVPSNAALMGAVYYNQWIALNQTCLVIGCTPNALFTSDAAMITLGL